MDGLEQTMFDDVDVDHDLNLEGSEQVTFDKLDCRCPEAESETDWRKLWMRYMI